MHPTRLRQAVRLPFVITAVCTSISFLLLCSEHTPNPMQVQDQTKVRLIGKTAVFVVGSKTLGAGDDVIKTRLDSMGFTVTLKDDDSVAPKDTNYSLIIISATVNPFTSAGIFRRTGKPVLCMEPELFDDMSMTGGNPRAPTSAQKTGRTSVNVIDSTHVLASGYSGAVTVTSSSETFGWGVPNSNAAKVAVLSTGTDTCVVFGYEKSSLMIGNFTAPSRRVGFFFHDATAASANGAGIALLNRAAVWAIGALNLDNAPDYHADGPPDGLALPYERQYRDVRHGIRHRRCHLFCPFLPGQYSS